MSERDDAPSNPANGGGQEQEALRQEVEERFHLWRRWVLTAAAVVVPVIIIVVAVNASQGDGDSSSSSSSGSPSSGSQTFSNPTATQFRRLMSSTNPNVWQVSDEDITAAATVTCADIKAYGANGAAEEITANTKLDYSEAVTLVNVSHAVYCPGLAG